MGCAESAELKPARRSKRPSIIISPEQRAPGQDSTQSEFKLRAGQFIQRREEPISSHYEIIKQIGFGSYGKVFVATHRESHQRRAVKEINKPLGHTEEYRKQFITEVEILSKLDHPNIVKIYELYEDEDHYHIVAELLSGGELFDYITSARHLSEPVAANIMYQVLSAVSYCHEHHIVHRDLKPENLLLESPTRVGGAISVKVIDFGTSCLYAKESLLSQRLGTAYYIAPEVLEMNYNEKCDVWSCGVILFVLLGGYPPFSGRSDTEIFSKVCTGAFSFEHPNWIGISQEAKDLISRMLQRDFSARISAEQCLQHPWIRKYHDRMQVDATGVLQSLTNLKSFHEEQRLRKAILAFIAAQIVTIEQTKQLTAAFKALDKNGDGRLSRQELIDGYSQLMSMEAAQEQVEMIMKAVDFDGNGFIDYSEFITGSLNKQVLLSRSNLELAFLAFDRDKSGQINLNELKSALSLVEETDDSLWRELISEVDQNRDGEIDMAEFTTLMLKASGQKR